MLTVTEAAAAPIGWDGLSLKQMLESSESLARETGHYQGLEELSFKDADPIRYEKLYSRLRGGVVMARETAARIAASPLVEEMGEVCFTLYTPEGDSIALSTGIIVHVHTMSAAIKHMIRSEYEVNPGIAPGDIFVNNDPAISNVHCADVQTMVPIFHEGELLGWAAGVTHEVDVGAKTPGSNAVGPINRFEDGIDIPAMKVGKNDELFQDYVARCKRMTRTPLYWTLDEKTRVAGCHMMRKLVLELVASEGADVYKQFVREVIEEGRRSFRHRTREQLIPGVYRSPVFIDYQFDGERSLPEQAAGDGVLHAPVEARVQADGQLKVSLEGANGWGLHAFNCSPEGMNGALWAVLAETLMSYDKVNDGANFASSLELPEGSWANPGTGTTSHSNSWYILVPTFAALARSISRGYFSRGYVEEVVSGWGDGNYLQGGSMDAVGEQSVVSNMETSCVGAGAGVVQDGLDYASSAWFPTGDMGDVEDWERMEPLLYLGRRVMPNSGGFGRRRGGMGFESLRMVWTDAYTLQYIGDGAMLCQAGLYGGYPAPGGYRHSVFDTDLPERFDKRLPYPVGGTDPGFHDLMTEVEGRRVLDRKATTVPHPFHRHDLYLSIIRGGPGLGDPLQREIGDVQGDLDEGNLLAASAETIYGVVFGGDGRVDAEATASRRKAILAERGERAVPVAEWIDSEREATVLKGDVIQPVKDMYRSSMSLSPPWAETFRTFWDLDEEFTF
ncbi:MAG: hydantoinase B/oxoprolinase family protein [Actinobacteria bacterium]|nr:hydantoinase B/oxoprolinase family protein [Actinomycetota bacterium]